MTALRLVVLAIALLVGDIAAVGAQTPPTLPPGVTKEQFDAMTDAISKAMVQKLMAPEQFDALVDALSKAMAEKMKSDGAKPAPAPIKFNFGFPRDTDVEKLRHTAEKIGLEMQDDPAYRLKILEPLRMQGVVEITDKTLIVQFKFTARPGNPDTVRRDAMMRMVHAFPDLGIEFGNATASP